MAAIDHGRAATIKRRIEKNVIEATKKWQENPDCKVSYGTPQLSYVSVDHPLFMAYFEKGVCMHPKQIYRPGNTVILAYVPYSQETVDSNRGKGMPSQLWLDSFYDSMHLGMHLNKVIRGTLDKIGRIHSPTNSPTDWNEDEYRAEWSHKLAAYAAGMGHYGFGGAFHTDQGFAGRFTSILVDEKYSPIDDEDIGSIDVENAVESIWADCGYIEAGNVTVGEETIQACPGKAITERGIDRSKCQEFCKTINEYIPAPEICGKCFYCGGK